MYLIWKCSWQMNMGWILESEECEKGVALKYLLNKWMNILLYFYFFTQDCFKILSQPIYGLCILFYHNNVILAYLLERGHSHVIEGIFKISLYIHIIFLLGSILRLPILNVELLGSRLWSVSWLLLTIV